MSASRYCEGLECSILLEERSFNEVYVGNGVLVGNKIFIITHRFAWKTEERSSKRHRRVASFLCMSHCRSEGLAMQHGKVQAASDTVLSSKSSKLGCPGRVNVYNVAILSLEWNAKPVVLQFLLQTHHRACCVHRHRDISDGE